MKSHKHYGFSFIEVMVVVVIIALMAGAVGTSVKKKMDNAKKSRAKGDIASIVNGIEEFYLLNGRYPTNEEGLSTIDITHTTDAWGNQYIYNSPGRSSEYDVISYGADGREGGTGADEDIYSDQLSDTKL